MKDPGTFLAFARNNVMCTLDYSFRLDRPRLDLAALAAAVDARIASLPDLSPASFDALRPVITDFSPATAVIQSAEGSNTAFKITISDPSGEPTVRQVTTDGSLQIGEEGGTVYAFATHVLGAVPVDLVVINASLQFSRAQTSITVTP